MILAKFYQKFLPKCQSLVSQAQRTVFFLSTACSKFVPKRIHQIARFQLQKYNIFQHLTPPCVRKCAIGADAPPNHPPPHVEDGSTPLHHTWRGVVASVFFLVSLAGKQFIAASDTIFCMDFYHMHIHVICVVNSDNDNLYTLCNNSIHNQQNGAAIAFTQLSKIDLISPFTYLVFMDRIVTTSSGFLIINCLLYWILT